MAAGLWSVLARPRARPRRGEGPLGLRSAREIVSEREALEAEDLAQLLAVTNARRRARGLPERTDDDALREFSGRSGGSPGGDSDGRWRAV